MGRRSSRCKEKGWRDDFREEKKIVGLEKRGSQACRSCSSCEPLSQKSQMMFLHTPQAVQCWGRGNIGFCFI